MTYQCFDPFDWLEEKVFANLSTRFSRPDENFTLHSLFDFIETYLEADSVQNYFQSDMEKDGYFEEAG